MIGQAILRHYESMMALEDSDPIVARNLRQELQNFQNFLDGKMVAERKRVYVVAGLALLGGALGGFALARAFPGKRKR
jgi:hypothetical protein